MTKLTWEAALDRLVGAYAPNTLIAYRSDYADFASWCAASGHQAFPTSTSTLLTYLEQLPPRLKPTTVRRRVISIGRLHVLAGLQDPAEDIEIAIALRRRYRQHAAYPEQAHGLTRDKLQRLLDTCDDSVRGLRDRAMLLVGFEALCRRSELVGLSVSDIGTSLRGTPAVQVHESKNGPFIRRRWATLSREGFGALRDWLSASGIVDGPLFRPVYHQTIVQRRICSFTLVRVLKERARLAGFPNDVVAQLSGHSLRVGAAQQLAINGYDVAQIMRVGGWKSITALSRYIEGAEVDVW